MSTLILPGNGHELPLPSPKGVQKLLSDPLSALSQWYSNHFRHGDAEEEEKEEIALVQLSSDNQATHPRLHESAESCLSSLRAGTASIVITSTHQRGIHFLNLPVRQHPLLFVASGVVC